MSTAVQLIPRPLQIPSIGLVNLVNDSTRRRGTALQHKEDLPYAIEEENSTQTLNDPGSLKGIVKTYTILVVGEPGVGKSSFLQFLANALAGNDIDHYDSDILDHTNEQSRNNQTQTSSTRLYKVTSSNGVVVRILDTPGLANTRSVQQDELHKRSVATQVKELVESVTAVLILANGTVARSTVGIDNALSTLSFIFPKTPIKNIGFMFTNVSNPLCLNFCEETVPASLQGAPWFQIDNPIALQKKFLKLKGYPEMKERRVELCEEVKAAKQDALETVVELFDWLGGLELQPTMKIPPMARSAAKEAKIPVPASNRKPASNHNKFFSAVSNFYSACSMQLYPVCVLVAILIHWIHLLCSQYADRYLFRVHTYRARSQRDIFYAVDNTTDELPRFAEDHAGRWLSGSVLVRLEIAVSLLEQNGKDTEEKGVSHEQLENMRRGLEQVKRTLELMRVAKEKVWEGIQKVKRIFIRARMRRGRY